LEVLIHIYESVINLIKKKTRTFVLILFSILQLIQDLLKSLPQMFTKSLETQSALGPALQAAFKLMSPSGGRISVFQTQLPSVGMGALKSREEPNQRATAKVRKAKKRVKRTDSPILYIHMALELPVFNDVTEIVIKNQLLVSLKIFNKHESYFLCIL